MNYSSVNQHLIKWCCSGGLLNFFISISVFQGLYTKLGLFQRRIHECQVHLSTSTHLLEVKNTSIPSHLHVLTLLYTPFLYCTLKRLSICYLLKREWFLIPFQQELENRQQDLAQTIGLTLESTWTKDLLQCNTQQVHYHLNLMFTNLRYMPY